MTPIPARAPVTPPIRFARIDARDGAVAAAIADNPNGPQMPLISGAQEALPEFAGRALNRVSGVIPCDADGRMIDLNNSGPRESRIWKREIQFVDVQASALMR